MTTYPGKHIPPSHPALHGAGIDQGRPVGSLPPARPAVPDFGTQQTEVAALSAMIEQVAIDMTRVPDRPLTTGQRRMWRDIAREAGRRSRS